MTTPESNGFPYATFLDVKYPQLAAGRFIIDLEDRAVDLGPQQGFVVPKGVIHRTQAPERAVILMVETAAIIPTGEAAEPKFVA